MQAADIALYKANIVPVGADQLPHLELTREILRRFHSLYGKKIFPEPEALLTERPKLLGLDNRKMSKSYNNYIAICENPDEIRKKVQTMITDPKRIKLKDKGHPKVCNVFSYYKGFTPKEKVGEVEHWCKNAQKGCAECKKEMAEILIEHLGPYREKRKWLEEKKRERVIEPYMKSLFKAREKGDATLKEVKDALSVFHISLEGTVSLSEKKQNRNNDIQG